MGLGKTHSPTLGAHRAPKTRLRPPKNIPDRCNNYSSLQQLLKYRPLRAYILRGPAMENNTNNCFENGNIFATQQINRFQIGVIFHDQISKGFGNDSMMLHGAPKHLDRLVSIHPIAPPRSQPLRRDSNGLRQPGPPPSLAMMRVEPRSS